MASWAGADGDGSEPPSEFGYITKDIIEEQERLTQEEEENEERAAKELQEQRYKRLMHLLTRSKFYTEFLLQRLSDTKEEGKGRDQQIQLSKKKGKQQDPVLTPRKLAENTPVQNDESPVRRLRVKRTGAENSIRKKRKFDDQSYDISTVISSKDIKNAAPSVQEEIESKPNGNSDATRCTDLGYVVSVRQPLLCEGGVMRDYQLDGLDWLKCTYENGMNGILADEMGLGKTVQVIALICHLIENECNGPFLIIGPLSTLPNWMLEFEKFAPQVPILLYAGNQQQRYPLVKDIKKPTILMGVKVFPVTVTSYELITKDFKLLKAIKWNYIIVDEGHRLKNDESTLSRTLRQFRAGSRLLLTGTPLQNNLKELWSLLNFLLPEIFNDLNLFESWFDVEELQEENNEKIIKQEEQKNILSTMHQILTPFLLRRLKCDVDLNIPPKKELLVFAPMSPLQANLYKFTVDHSISLELGIEKNNILEDTPDGQRQKRKCTLEKKNYSFSDENSDSDCENVAIEINGTSEQKKNAVEVVDPENRNYSIHITMQSPAVQLRKIVNHPYLIQMPLIPGKKELKVDEDLINKSGKLLVVDAMLAKLKPRGHKVLIFSTSTMLLDLLEEYALYRKFSYRRLDGMTKLEDRRRDIKKFNMDPNIFLYLISTRAGGLGINLTSADTVIIFDSDWNPQADLQAQDRCHRIGQTKPVVVYRLATSGTIDEKIVERAAAKRKLEKMIIHKDKFKLRVSGDMAMNSKDLRDLLNSRDYQKVIHSNGYVFTDDELEALLDRSDLEDPTKGKKAADSKIFRSVPNLDT